MFYNYIILNFNPDNRTGPRLLKPFGLQEKITFVRLSEVDLKEGI